MSEPYDKAVDPVHEFHGTWWFYDEVWVDAYGPYDSEERARLACTAYADIFLEGRGTENDRQLLWATSSAYACPKCYPRGCRGVKEEDRFYFHCGFEMGAQMTETFKLEVGSEAHGKRGVLVSMLVSCAFDKEDDGWIGVRPGAIWAESIDVLKNTIETVIHDLCVDCDSNAELLIELSRWYLDCDDHSESLFGADIKSQLRVTIDGDVVLDIDTVN